MRPPLLGLIALACALPGPARAADPDFSSDRPGFSNSTTALPLGRYALELGVGLGAPLEGSADPSFDVPAALVRVGLPWGLEARVGLPSLQIRPEAEGDQVGASDLGFGVKLSFEDSLQIPVSVVASMTVPTGVNGYGADEVTADLNLNYAYSSGAFGLSVATFVGYADEALQLSAGAGASLTLGDVSPYVQAFYELSSLRFELIPSVNLDSHSLGLGAGLAWMVGDRVQLDASFDVLPLRRARRESGNLSIIADPPVELRAGIGTTILL